MISGFLGGEMEKKALSLRFYCLEEKKERR